MQLLSYLTPGFPQTLFEALGAVIGAEVSFDERFSGPAPGTNPFKDGTTDLGWICSTSYVELATRGSDPTIRLVGVAWVPDDPDVDGRPVYFGDIVTRQNSTIKNFADLEGRRVGCNDPVSLSGHHALRFAARERGYDADSFAELVFTGAHQRSLELVLSGDLDAAVIDSVVRTSRARVDQRVRDLAIVKRLGPWPVQPLVARADMDDSDIESIRRSLLEAAGRPDIRRELTLASLAGLVQVGPDHYDSVGLAMQSAGPL